MTTINDRFDALITTVAKIESANERIESLLTRHDRFLFGDPGERKPGLLTRVDRLEVSHRRQVWLVRATAGAVVTIIAGCAASIVAFLRGLFYQS